VSGKSGLLVTEVRRRVRSRVEQFAAIRRDHRVDGLSIRALADKHGVHRRTVRQALAPSAAIYPPPPSMAETSSTPSSCCRGPTPAASSYLTSYITSMSRMPASIRVDKG
jgi:hypothetical protein